MFVAGHSIKDVDINNDSIEVYKSDQIEIQPGIWHPDITNTKIRQNGQRNS